MKTSNKILTAFIAIIFLVPFFLLLSFSSKVKNGQYTVVKNEFGGSNSHQGSITAYNVVKIIGPGQPGVFTCKIIPSDSASYKYFDYDNYRDSISVEQQGDTLFVKYINSETENIGNTEYTHLAIDLYLPVMKKIIVEGADVRIDSINGQTNAEISFQLLNEAHLKLAETGPSKSVTIKEGLKDESTVIERSGVMNKVEIKAVNGNVTIGRNALIRNIDLQIQGASKINVDNNSQIDQLTGFISDSSTVSANWKNLKRLATLAER